MTIVGISQMQMECLAAQRYLEEVGVRAEVIDPIWLSPLDMDTIVESVEKTGRLLVVDNGWMTCGAGAEIVAQVAERLMGVRDRARPADGLCPGDVSDDAGPGSAVLSQRPHHRRRRSRPGGRERDRLAARRASRTCKALNSRGRSDEPRRDRLASRLDWPLMKNNITRDDLDAVVRLLQPGRPILTQSRQRPRLRARVVATGSACGTASSSTPARRPTGDAGRA